MLPSHSECDHRGQTGDDRLITGFLRLDRRAIACADGQGAVHHALHVAGPAGLVAGFGKLIGNIFAESAALLTTRRIRGRT
jgi:hypothetical protein